MNRSSTRHAAGAFALVATLLGGASVGRADPTELSPQEAYNYGENETPRTAAMGGALRALGNGTTGVWLTPADMVQTRIYHIEALAQIVPEARRQVYGGIIADSITGKLAGGLSVAGGFIDPDGIDRSFIDARAALAYPISDKLYLGLSGRYAKVDQSPAQAPFGVEQDKVAGGLVDPEERLSRFSMVNTFTFDAGVTLRATESLYIAVLGQSLSYPGHSVLPTTLGGGIGYGTQDFSVEVDGVADFNSWQDTSARIMAGGELLLGDHFPLRGGYRWDQGADTHSASGGLGYIGQEFSAEVSVRRSLANPGATTIVIGLAYFLESTGLTRAPTDF
ncbi:MAG: hypothetical protein WKG00_17055 [Polyangiaceae bacterium]